MIEDKRLGLIPLANVRSILRLIDRLLYPLYNTPKGYNTSSVYNSIENRVYQRQPEGVSLRRVDREGGKLAGSLSNHARLKSSGRGCRRNPHLGRVERHG